MVDEDKTTILCHATKAFSNMHLEVLTLSKAGTTLGKIDMGGGAAKTR